MSSRIQSMSTSRDLGNRQDRVRTIDEQRLGLGTCARHLLSLGPHAGTARARFTALKRAKSAVVAVAGSLERLCRVMSGARPCWYPARPASSAPVGVV